MRHAAFRLSPGSILKWFLEFASTALVWASATVPEKTSTGVVVTLRPIPTLLLN